MVSSCRRCVFSVSQSNEWLFLSLSKFLDIHVFNIFLSFKMSYFIKDTTAHFKLHFQLFLQSPRYYRNEIWSDGRATCGKHFQLVFRSIVKTRN